MRNKWLLISVLLNVLGLLVFMLLIHKLGGPRYVWYKWKNGGVSGVYEHRRDMHKRMEIDSGAIVFIGNSITAQGSWREFFKREDIYNRGIEGDMTSGLLERLPGILVTRPQKLFLMIGINDLISHGPADVVNNYRKIINIIQQQTPATSVYIQSVLPVNNQVRNSGISNDDVATINKAIKELAAQNNMHYIDLQHLLRDREGSLSAAYTRDGVHLNGKAYLIWRDAIRQYIEE